VVLPEGGLHVAVHHAVRPVRIEHVFRALNVRRAPNFPQTYTTEFCLYIK
jgi:hypothetical protein